MKDRIVNFLNDLDTALIAMAQGRQLSLYHIGRSALVWKYGFASATEDVDVILPGQRDVLLDEAIRLFGRATKKAVEHGLYLEQVPEGLPPAPGNFAKRAVEVEERWIVLRVFHLEPNDLATTKMKRFWPKDRVDIRMMCDSDLLDPDQLEIRLNSAFRYTMEKDGDRDRDAAFAHLKIVQKYLREGIWVDG